MATTVKPLYLDPNFGTPTEAGSTATLQVGSFKALGISGVAFDAGGNLVSNLATPVSPGDAVNLQYLSGLLNGISVIQSVKVMSNANLSLTGLQTVDGISLAAGDRVLLTAQTNGVQNGVWIVASGSWTRPTQQNDYVTGRQFAGLTTYIEAGTNFASEQWAAVGAGTGKIDTDPSTWTQLTGAAEIVAGTGLAKSAINGNTLSVVLASNSGLQFTGNQLDHLLNTAGGIQKGSSGLALTLNSNNTLAVDGNGLRTLGVPTLWTINGAATSAAVSAPNLNTLTAGTASLADSLHQHTETLRARATGETLTNGGTALAAGDPVAWGATADTLARADASVQSTSTACFGVALAGISANGTGVIIRRGIAQGILSQATPGSAYYLAVSGGLTSTMPTAANASVVRIGIAKNATDLDVNPVVVVARGAG